MEIDTGEFRAVQAGRAEVQAEVLADVAEWAGNRTLHSRGHQPPPVLRMLVEHAFECGAEVWAHDFGHVLLALRHERGLSDTELIEAALEMVAARMMVGLPDEEWFTPDGGP